MLFKLDENLPFILKKIIEDYGDHQVDSVFHENLAGIDDKSLIEHCLKEKRVLISLDTDFMKPTMKHYGIIILRSITQGKQAVRILFQHFLEHFDLKETKRKIIIVELNHIRIRID